MSTYKTSIITTSIIMALQADNLNGIDFNNVIALTLYNLSIHYKTKLKN